jgi:nicotinamide-nucleotide amidase
MLINTLVYKAANNLAASLVARQSKVCVAESCTGGAVAAAFTAIAGSSAWFELGIVTYSNRFKTQLLNVAESTIERHGVVSEVVVEQMLLGICSLAQARFGIAISGIAGPNGGSEQKPTGTVCFALGSPSRPQLVTRLFAGDRDQVREQSVLFALRRLTEYVEKSA